MAEGIWYLLSSAVFILIITLKNQLVNIGTKKLLYFYLTLIIYNVILFVTLFWLERFVGLITFRMIRTFLVVGGFFIFETMIILAIKKEVKSIREVIKYFPFWKSFFSFGVIFMCAGLIYTGNWFVKKGLTGLYLIFTIGTMMVSFLISKIALFIKNRIKSINEKR